MPFIGQLSGRHYNGYEEMVVGERLAAARRDASIIAEDDAAIASVPIETLRKIADRAMIAEDEALGGNRSRQDVKTWLALHPEYIDNEHNACTMNHELSRMGVRINPTVEENERAYNAVTADGLLDLNQKVLREQEAKRARDRAAGIRENGGPLASPYTEEELENMPLEQLRMVSNSVLSR